MGFCKEKWVIWLSVQIGGKKSIVSWALLKGAVLKYGLVKVNSTVTSLDTSRYHEI